jgi:hypothetical protein
MERLTEVVYKKGYCKRKPACEGSCEDCDHFETMVDRLAYYEELEEQGLLLRLPCKVGDTVYYIDDYYVYADKVNSIGISKENDEYVFCIDFMDYRYDDFGKRVFLTKEEAEQKLAEMKGA